MKSLKTIALALILAQVLLTATSAQAQNPVKYWTTVGSAGTVDDSDADKIVYDHGNVSLKGVLSSTNTTLAAREQELAVSAREEAEQVSQAALAFPQRTVKAVLRYNVTAVDGLFTNGFGGPADGYAMTVRFRDNGGRAQVLVRLIEYDLATGGEIVRLTLDSNQYPAQVGYQTRSVGSCFQSPAWRFDFQNKAYYVEATLSSTAPLDVVLTGDPGLGMVQIFGTVCLF